jgi:ATP-dependent 26S proteasome regulatory subunit
VQFNLTCGAVGSVVLKYRLNDAAAARYVLPAASHVQVHKKVFGSGGGGFQFEDVGIGGLDRELQTIVRRAFMSRLVPPHLSGRMGIDHVRGMLLYGPPGCGKTTVARQIGALLDTHPPKVVAGPEIISKYLGESEQKVRALFTDAAADAALGAKGSGRLHLIVFDEIDALVSPTSKSVHMYP